MWQGTRNTAGYGLFYVAPGKVMTAHRWAYLHWNGPIPEGHDVDHDCHNRDVSCLGGKTDPHRMCVRPEDLVPATRSENLLRGNQSANAKLPLHVRELARARTARYRARKKETKHDRPANP